MTSAKLAKRGVKINCNTDTHVLLDGCAVQSGLVQYIIKHVQAGWES